MNHEAAVAVADTVVIDVIEGRSINDEFGTGALGGGDDDNDDINDYLPPSLHFNRNTMDISVKPKSRSGGNFSYGPQNYLQNSRGGKKVTEMVCMPSMEDFEEIEMDDNDLLCEIPDYDPSSHPPPLHTNTTTYTTEPPTSIINNPVRSAYPKILPKPNFNNGQQQQHNTLEDTERKVMKGLMLRSPRGNQPRTYTQEELFQALNAIKSGLSIYRASQRYKVPRKTLRNWMKRWQIKSVYPMPAQLQRAAEKKKEQRDQVLANISLFQENLTSQTHLVKPETENHIS